MSKSNYLFYSEYLKKRDLNGKVILIAKTNKSYLIGPIIDLDFYEESFYKRIKSNSIYSTKIYKTMLKRKCDFLIDKYLQDLKSNQIIEVYKNGEKVLHSILKVPGEIIEKK